MESGFVKDFGTSAPKHSAWRNAASAAASPDTLRKHRRSSTASTSRAAPEPVEQDACSPSKSPAPPVPPVPVDLGVCRPSSSVHMSSATCALSLATKTTPPAGSASYKSSASCEVSTGTIHSQGSQPVEGVARRDSLRDLPVGMRAPAASEFALALPVAWADTDLGSTRWPPAKSAQA